GTGRICGEIGQSLRQRLGGGLQQARHENVLGLLSFWVKRRPGTAIQMKK
ncbi:8098_t:CDS:1, partial [Paraglomus brasilianum]